MKKGIAFAIGIVMCLQSFAGFAANEKNSPSVIAVYCAPNGSDDASGNIDSPLKTLDGARNKVLQIKRTNPDVPVNVYFRGGEYKVSKTTKFTEADSGTENAPVTYMAYENEKPIFTGATRISADYFKPLSLSEKSRVPEEARSYVGVADLKKIGVNGMTRYEGFNGTEYIEEVQNTSPTFLYNNREQSLARWPNGMLNFTATKDVVSASEFAIDAKNRMSRWITADNAVLFGWFQYGYSPARVPVKKFEPEQNKIYTEFDVPRGVVSDRHCSVTNLLEELDVPGEFYVDTTNMKLYFYPPYTDKNADMELVTNENVIVKMDGASYINFKNLSFRKNRNDAFEMRQCDNISLLGCEFRNISLMGIDTMWCTNTMVDGCDFFYMGSTGVRLDERNDGHYLNSSVDINSVRVDLTPDNNAINNCYFYDIAKQSIMYTGAVRIHGVGNKLTRSSMHNALNSLVHHGGNDIKMTNNELWGALKFSRDMGMIYNGRNVTQRGNETAYNYFHDWETANPQAGGAYAIYDDDNLTGNYKHHNIIADGEDGLSNGGTMDGHFMHNIVANNNSPGFVGDQGWLAGTWLASMESFVTRQIPQVYTLKEYQKYRNINKMFFEKPWPTNVKVEGNLFFENRKNFMCGENVKLNGSFKDNILDGSAYAEYFNDKDNGDYTIRTDIEVPSELKELQKIQLNDIGIYESDTRKTADYGLGEFKAYYPYQYTDDVDSGNVFLAWEQSENADRYILELSDTPDFENITYTKDCPLNYAALDDLEPDKTTYYWRVKAVCDGMKNREELMCTNDVMVFRTGMIKNVDKTLLETEIAKSEDFVSKFTEGTENGNFAYGVIEDSKELIEKAKGYVTSREETQRNVDEMAMMLQNMRSDAAKLTQIYYSDIKEVFNDSAEWTKNDVSNVTRAGGTVKLQTAKVGSMGVVSSTASPIDYKSLKRFRLKTGVAGTAQASVWQAISFDSAECAGKRVLDVAGGKGFMLLIKGTTIELQIRDGVQGALVVSAESPFTCGEFSDVEFGIITTGVGQRYVLNVDGENAIDYLCTDRTLDGDLFVAMYDSPMITSVPQTEGIELAPLEATDPVIYLGNKVSLGNMDFSKVVGSNSISAANGEKFSAEKIENDYAISAKIKYNADLGEQGIVFRSSSADLNGESYIAAINGDKLLLKKRQNGVEQVLSMASMAGVPNETDIKINAGYIVGGLRISIIADSTELIDFTDAFPIKNHGYIGVYSKSSEEIKLEQR